MAIKALTGLVPEWFTPDSQKGEDEPARFKLKPLNSPDLVEIQSYHNEEKGRIEPKGLYRAFEISISEWENVNDAEGKPLKCTRNNLKVIPISVIAECGSRAINISYLSGEEEKNL